MSRTIQQIIARQILDSRGNPTIEAEVWTSSGIFGRAAVPSGASTGSREALELRDGNVDCYQGKSVYKAIHNIQKVLAPALKGMDVCDQQSLDRKMLELDGSDFKSHLGANALLGVSLATARAGAQLQQKPLYRYLLEDLKVPNKAQQYILPAPLMNILNGGAHAANNLDIQEFMIVPHLPLSFAENLRAGVEIFHTLKKLLQEKNYSTNVGDEGGFAPNLSSQEEGMDMILKAIEQAGYRPQEQVSLALDVAASEFYKEGSYQMGGDSYSSDEMIEYFKSFAGKYPLYSIEDGLDESDHKGWKHLTDSLGRQLTLVGDDLFVTNQKILQEGIRNGEANAILIKVNQIGTLSETFDTIAMAYKHNYKVVISHRSGETEDSFIADLAVACGAGHIKTGSASRSDRMSKYNQLLRIEEDLADKAVFNQIGI